MAIADDDIEKVRAATDIVAVISEHVALRRSGTRWVGLCPFHAEKTGSFSVNAEMGFFYCFGCQAKGDAITFVREVAHLDFVGAVESLAGRAGIQLTYDNVQESGRRRRRSVLVDAMGKAVEWYHQRLLTAPDAAHARGYLRSRGYDGEVVRQFKLGWAPEGWDVLCSSIGLPADVLRDTGLGFVNKRNRLQDSFRGRVLFPILDARGDAVALGGRILPGGEGPKYKNSPATEIYDKSEVLYGLSWAKSDVVAHDEVVVCEGYTDVIGFATSGVPRAVATCGTALTERHVAALRRFARRIVLAFDADAAGQGAAERFYEWERRYEADVAVALLPSGADPGDLARSDPAALARAVSEARPFLAFRLERLLDASDLGTAEGRARAAEHAMEMIGEHPSELVRDQYVMQVADRCRLDPDRLRAGVATARSRPVRAAEGDGETPRGRRQPAGGGRRQESASMLALRLAVHRPEEVAETLHEALFSDELELAAYRALATASTLHEAVATADPEAAELLQRLAVEEADADPADVVRLLLVEAVRPVVRDLESSARSDGDPLEASQLVGWLKLRTEELWEERTRPAAAQQLVAFLADRAQEGT
ncbi:MAG TPA: DNA primase [Acidimicrobiales bacterium]|nr:DNA primase [Acidimicrobiales bacterium]